MNLEAVKNIGITRVGWRDDKTIPGLVFPAQTPASGRFFQDEHSAITLRNIRDCQSIEGISDSDFIDFLDDLNRKAVYQVLDDSLERDYVDDDLLDLYPRIFDQAIMLRMVINVAELIMTSTRTNDSVRFSRAFLGKLNYDIYRDTVQKFASSNRNFKYNMGISARYEDEIRSLQRRLGGPKNMIGTITMGAVSNPHILLNDLDDESPLN